MDNKLNLTAYIYLYIYSKSTRLFQRKIPMAILFLKESINTCQRTKNNLSYLAIENYTKYADGYLQNKHIYLSEAKKKKKKNITVCNTKKD